MKHKTSPFVEGMLSVLMITPTVSYAKANFITHQPSSKSKVEQINPWLQVGNIMKEVAKPQIDYAQQSVNQ